MSNKDRIGDLLLGDGEDPAKALIEARLENVRLKSELSEACDYWHDWRRRALDFDTQLAAAESKIAALKVDLAGVQKERDLAQATADLNTKRCERGHAMEFHGKGLYECYGRARDAALADLSQARAELEATKKRRDDLLQQTRAAEAKLARALAALRDARPYVENGGPMEQWGGPNKRRPVLASIDAILADPESTAAVEALKQRDREEVSLVEWLKNAVEHLGVVLDLHLDGYELRPGEQESIRYTITNAKQILAHVEARRAGGKDGADFPPLGDCPRCGKPWRTWGTDAEPLAEVICDGGHSAPHPWGRAAEAHARKGGR